MIVPHLWPIHVLDPVNVLWPLLLLLFSSLQMVQLDPFNVGVTVSDGLGKSSSTTVTVVIEDDSPEVTIQAQTSAMLLLDESLGIREVLALLCILAGLVLVNQRKSTRVSRS